MPDYQRRMALAHALVDDGRTVKQFAHDVGLSHVTVSGVFTGRIDRPTERVKQLIASGLGVSVDEVFDADEQVLA